MGGMKKLLAAMFVALLMAGFLSADLTGKDFKATMKLAMQGNASAQNGLGYMYNYGEGVSVLLGY
jgi:hypothetical protein